MSAALPVSRRIVWHYRKMHVSITTLSVSCAGGEKQRHAHKGIRLDLTKGSMKIDLTH